MRTRSLIAAPMATISTAVEAVVAVDGMGMVVATGTKMFVMRMQCGCSSGSCERKKGHSCWLTSLRLGLYSSAMFGLPVLAARQWYTAVLTHDPVGLPSRAAVYLRRNAHSHSSPSAEDRGNLLQTDCCASISMRCALGTLQRAMAGRSQMS